MLRASHSLQDGLLLEERVGPYRSRLMVMSVEQFVGQNISEIGGFSTPETKETLKNLFDRYNSRWVAQVGAKGITIEVR